MGDHQNTNYARELNERDGVRKASSGGAMNPKFWSDARVGRERARVASDRREYGVDLCQELTAKTFTPLLVPRGGG